MGIGKEKTYVGEWWIPGKAKRKVKGILRLAAEGGGSSRLELIGLFEQADLISFFDVSRNNPRVVFGEAGGRLFTLIQNHVSDKSIGLKVPHATLTPRLVLEGLHLKDLSKNLFTSMTVDYTHLEEWCAENVFYGDLVFDDEKPLRVNVTGIPFRSDPIALPSLDTELVIAHRIEPKQKKYKSVELTDTVTMKFKPAAPKSFEWFEELIEKFQIMLALFTGQAVYAERLALDGTAAVKKSKSKKGKSVSRKDEAKTICVRVYYDQMPPAARPDEPEARPAIIPFARIKTDAAKILNHYLEKYADLKQVFQLLLGSVYEPDFLAQSRFLNLMQAVETFHRRAGASGAGVGGAATAATAKEKGRYLSAALHDELKRELKSEYERIFKRFADELRLPAGKSAYPEDSAESLAKLEKIFIKRLDLSNEASLRSRLELIFKNLSKEEAKLVCDKPKSFIHHTTATRDYLTHYDESGKASALTGIELFRATEGLRVLLLVLIMRELGIEEKARVEIVGQSERLNFRGYRAVEFD